MLRVKTQSFRRWASGHLLYVSLSVVFVISIIVFFAYRSKEDGFSSFGSYLSGVCAFLVTIGVAVLADKRHVESNRTNTKTFCYRLLIECCVICGEIRELENITSKNDIFENNKPVGISRRCAIGRKLTEIKDRINMIIKLVDDFCNIDQNITDAIDGSQSAYNAIYHVSGKLK